MKRTASGLSLALLLVACGDSESGGGGSGGTGSGGSSSTSTSSSSPSGTGGGGTGTGGASTTSGSAATGGTSGSSSATSASSGDASSSASSTSTVASGSTGGGTDDYAAERTACINRINELRATKGAFAYQQWGEAEICTDGQATSDESTGTPHGQFGSCGESSQNECLGHGPQGIVACLDQMWAEKDQPDCAGCDACADAYDPNCPGCDFYGQQNGQVCGHYVNMRALYFTEAACGFSDLGGWNVINFR